MKELLLGFILGTGFIMDIFFILWFYSALKYKDPDYEFLGASIGK